MSHVYIIRSGNTGAYKIGVAKDVEKRLEGLQVGNPEKLHIIAKYCNWNGLLGWGESLVTVLDELRQAQVSK